MKIGAYQFAVTNNINHNVEIRKERQLNNGKTLGRQYLLHKISIESLVTFASKFSTRLLILSVKQDIISIEK